MCGIVGLYLKSPELRPRLGALFAPMLVEMTERGPDSAGFAVYRDTVNGGNQSKVTVHTTDSDFNGHILAEQASEDLGDLVTVDQISTHTILRSSVSPSVLRYWIEKKRPDLRIMSSGSALEIYKETGTAADVLERFEVAQMTGTHIIGHTRMATESAVTTEGAHPFNTGEDLCLVHNGSLSNHHRLRDWLRDKQGVQVQTDNDSEVAAGYLTWRMGQGADIRQALETAIKDLDGFYTFAIGTRDGFSVLRDPIACKPAVMAETDDWVAMASEFRALARMPDVTNATVWEPKPGIIYSWGSA